MSNTLPTPSLTPDQTTGRQPIPASEIHYYEDPALAAAVETHTSYAVNARTDGTTIDLPGAEHTGAGREAFTVPVVPGPEPVAAHMTEDGLHNEQSSRWGGVWSNYRYKGTHRARRDEPSTQDRTTLTPGDESVKEVLAEVRETAYQTAYDEALPRIKTAGDVKDAEVRAQAVAQAAVTEAYQDIKGYKHGIHSEKGRAQYHGGHRRRSVAGKVVDWLTYSPEEIAAQDQAKRDAQDQKHQVSNLNNSEVFIPQTVNARSNRLRKKPSRSEAIYQQAVGVVPDTDYVTGRAEAPKRELKLPPAPTPEENLRDLIEAGARTSEEVFNEMYGDRVAGGSSVYGGKLLSENPGMWRKLSEAGTTNQDNVGPHERAIAEGYTHALQPVAALEGQVTDNFVPSFEIIEGELYPNTDPDDLTEDQRLIVQVLHERLLDLRDAKLKPGETAEHRVQTDHTHVVHQARRTARETLRDNKDRIKRAVGVVALHGAYWYAEAKTAVATAVRPDYVPAAPRNRRAAPSTGADHWRDPLDGSRRNEDPIRIYSPGELASLAGTWAFVRAQMILGGTLRGSRDWFRPRDIETGERSVSALRISGAMAAIVTAVAVRYGFEVNNTANDQAGFTDFVEAVVGTSNR